jgi:NAD(P)-dependent dehydrogenase (short-subunit alcohol dehydrogenase family)
MSMTAGADTDHGRALVTGATSGIGRAIALRLGGDGFEVIVHGRDTIRGDAVVEQVRAAGGQATFMAADLADPDDVKRLGAAVESIDVLVNNGGFSWFGPTADLDVATFDALYASNVRAPFLLVAALAPAMATNGSGTIINISSMAGQIGMSGGAAYGATKAALSSLTRAWAVEFSPHVRVNSVAPGPVNTGGAAPERTEALGNTTLLNRAANPEEIADVVAFLASAEASYLTGATIPIDGGRTAI